MGLRIMVEPDKETENEVRGIIMAKSTSSPFKSGTVVQVGEDVTADKFKRLKPGARVYFSKKAGSKVHSEEDTLIMHAENVEWVE